MYLWAVSALQGHVLCVMEIFFNFFLPQLKNILVLSQFISGFYSSVSAGTALVFKGWKLRPIFFFHRTASSVYGRPHFPEKS